MSPIINIAGYKFIKLDQLPGLRAHLKKYCTELQLKGTILLAPEGINIMLAGSEEATESFINSLNASEYFANIEFKKNYSSFVPFKRLLIKIKKEIITFAVSSINPIEKTAPRILPQQLKQWLDEKKDMVILDTRNQCEIEAGKFTKAVDLGINHFRNFSAAAKKLPESYKEKPVVTYCTGGVRCEKAAVYLMELGYKEVYQLDGGILKYFQECGDAYYEGKCFVFDERGVVEAA